MQISIFFLKMSLRRLLKEIIPKQLRVSTLKSALYLKTKSIKKAKNSFLLFIYQELVLVKN